MSKTLFEQATEAASFLQARLGMLAPKIAIVLGSGLNEVAEAVDEPVVVPYGEIPYFSQSTAIGHRGRIIAGKLGGVPVVMMQGRVHYYEGYTPQQVTFPMRVLGRFGIRSAVLTNAAGGLNPQWPLGQLVLLADHINFMGWNPAIGPNDDRLGLRFYDMTEAYSKRLRLLAHEAAAKEGITLAEGVYLAVTGPSFETPAEIRAFRTMGADLVGMSTVPETIIARHESMEVLGISCVTNLAAGLNNAPLNSEEVIEVGRMVEHRVSALLKRLVPEIAGLLSEPEI